MFMSVVVFFFTYIKKFLLVDMSKLAQRCCNYTTGLQRAIQKMSMQSRREPPLAKMAIFVIYTVLLFNSQATATDVTDNANNEC